MTPDNIYKYVKLYAHKVMIGSVESELLAMRHGLHDVVPAEILQLLKAEVGLVLILNHNVVNQLCS